MIETKGTYETGTRTTEPHDQTDAQEAILKAIKARQGQPEFRERLLEIFGYTCLVSGCEAEQALEAAHIDPLEALDGHRSEAGL